MSNEKQVEQLTNYMDKFHRSYSEKNYQMMSSQSSQSLRDKEDSPLSKTIYDTMFENQRLAVELNRPSCQDTGDFTVLGKMRNKVPTYR